jgi:site-specific DNA recombinase
MGQRAAIYCRISEDREGAGMGVDRQEADCRELAARLGWTVTEVYADNDISAHSGKRRPAYQDMLAALRAGEADAVICWHTDRLHRRTGRGPQELEEYIDLCSARGILTQGVRSGQLDLSNPTGRAVARTHAAWARQEVEHQIERQVAAREQKAKAGIWAGNKRPYGYEADGMTVVETEADALRWAASQLLQGVSLRAIAKALNAREDRTSTGGTWDSRTLGRVLRRPRNVGLSVYRGEVVGPARWPAIVDEATWKGVVAVLGDPSRRSNKGRPLRWLLVNLARCGICGERVISKGRAGRFPMVVYTCSAAAHLSRNAAEVDAFVEAVVIERLSRPDAAVLLAPDGAGTLISELHTRDAGLRARLDEQARLHAQGVIDARQLAEGTASIRTQREQITAELVAASRGSVLQGVADADDPEAAWQGLDLSRRRAILEVLLVVTVLPSRRGRRPGWEPGESYFDPGSVRIDWKRS